MNPKLNPELEEKIKECYGYTNEDISEKLQQISDKLDKWEMNCSRCYHNHTYPNGMMCHCTCHNVYGLATNTEINK